MKVLKKEGTFEKNIQFLFLLAAGFSVFLLVPLDCLFPGMGYFLAEKCLAVPGLLFFGSALTKRLSAPVKRNLLLSVIAILWFAAAQLQHHLSGMGCSSFGVFSIVYLLAFPFAAVADTPEKNAGLKWIGYIYVAASLLPVLCSILLFLDAVPEALSSYVFWDGARLQALWHPNVVACVLMIGIGLTLYFLVQADKTWKKAALALLAAIQFCGLVLTNGRTTILLGCGLFGGTVFFMIWKGGWKRFLAGLLAALAIIASLFLFSRKLFQFHTQVQISRLIQQIQEEELEVSEAPVITMDEDTGEVQLVGSNKQHGFLYDLFTFNNRIYIWDAAFTTLEDNPGIKIWGTENVSSELTYRNSFPVGHAHNSWIQTLLKLGLPGLLVALVFTAMTLFACAVLLLHPGAELPKKVAALLTLCILAAGFLEPYLFVGDIFTLFANFLFFLLTGYLDTWRRELPCKHKKAA